MNGLGGSLPFELTGPGWAAVGGAFAAAALAIVVLYLVRLRRRVVVVPFVALFRDALPDERTTRLFTRLRNVLSLLFALTIAALIALALGLPRWAERSETPRTVVIVLDGTASMQARASDGRARFEHAREAALDRIAELGPYDRVIVLFAGPEARVLHPLDDDHRLAARAVREAAPTDAPGTADEPLAWAAALCRRERPTAAASPVADSPVADSPVADSPVVDSPVADSPGPCEVLVLTDGGLGGLAHAAAALRSEGLDVRVALTRAEDEPAPANLAITALSARRFPTDPTRAEVMVEVTSHAPEPTRVALELAADGTLVHREELLLTPGASITHALDDLGSADAVLEARLLPVGTASPTRLDALAVDDVAYASLPPRRRRRVLVVREDTPDRDNTYLDAALLLDPYLDVVTTTPASYAASGPPADRQVVVFDGWVPETPPSLPSLVLDPGASPRAFVATGAPVVRPRFDTQLREHPLLAFLALRDVNIASARPLLPAPQDEVVGGEARGALLATGLRGSARFVALAFDVRESDLPLRIAWPILVLNALSFLVPDDLAVLEGARTGRPFRLEARGDVAPSLRRRGDPEGAALRGVLRDGASLHVLERVGVYDVIEPRPEEAGAPGRVVVASLFDEDESSLRAEPVEGATLSARGEDDRPAAGRPGEDEEGGTSLYVLVVAAALAMLALEWLTFHRRWTT
ncbi:MAG: BatA and WFA domain-containing protein [Sandaracinaceae bacterium]